MKNNPNREQQHIESLVDLEELYQNAPCGYFSFLPDGTIVKINRTLLKLLKLEEEEVVYKMKFIHLITKGSVIYYEMFYLPLIKMQGFVNEINFDIIRKDRSTFPALINTAAVLDEIGKIKVINATLIDITDRKKYEKELLYARHLAEAEKNQLEFLADFTPEIIFTADSEGLIDYVNKKFYNYFGFHQRHLTKEDVLLLIHPEDRKRCFRKWINCLRGAKEFKIEVRFKNSFGTYEWHLVKAIPYLDDEENILKWFGVCSNIHEQIVAMDTKDEFISIASHELKTPLTGLKAYIQLLIRNAPEGMKPFVSKTNVALNNLQFLVSGLLDISQIKAGQFMLSPTVFSLNEVIRLCVEVVKAGYTTHEVVEEYDANDIIYIQADKQRIIQVINNLLSNAIKYSPNADRVIIRIKRTNDNRAVKIEVQDFGIGIPPDKIDRVFEKYYRVKGSKNNNKVSGLGLGLYIIQSIIKLHGSTIFVESKVNEGSTFYFSLPLHTTIEEGFVSIPHSSSSQTSKT